MLIPDVPIEQYVRDAFDGPPSLNSGLAHVLLTRSAAHARYAHPRLNPAWEPDDDRDFDLGISAHAVLLENKPLHVVEITDEKTGEVSHPVDYRKKAAQQARDALKAAGKFPVLAHQASDIASMVTVARAKLRDCPDLEGIPLADLRAEQTIFWREGGALCRCRPDWMTADGRVIVSVKTTRASAEPSAFLRTLLGAGYHTQAAFELAAVKAETGADATYVWLAIETEPPYAASLVGMEPMLLDLAHRTRERAVALWSHCMATDAWPSYTDRIAYLEPPAWALAQWGERHMVAAGDTEGTVDDL